MNNLDSFYKLVDSIVSLLEQVDDTNFNDHITLINAKIKEYHTLKATFDQSQQDVISNVTKLINRTFDSIIRNRELECQNILVELDKISTQNKINNYRKIPSWILNQ